MWLFFAFTIQYFFFNKMNTCQITIFDVLADSSPSGIQLFWQRSHLEQTRELASLAFHLWMVQKMGLPSSIEKKKKKVHDVPPRGTWLLVQWLWLNLWIFGALCLFSSISVQRFFKSLFRDEKVGFLLEFWLAFN